MLWDGTDQRRLGTCNRGDTSAFSLRLSCTMKVRNEDGVSSFRALFVDDHRVEIPVIQRDYAQGREDEHSREVRKRFLDSLC